jgi:hypothetical protein
MLNPWLAITFQAARLGFEAQNAAAFRIFRLIGGLTTGKTTGGIADDIDMTNKSTEPQDTQTAATNDAPDRGSWPEAVPKVQKKRARPNTRKRSNGRSRSARVTALKASSSSR